MNDAKTSQALMGINKDTKADTAYHLLFEHVPLGVFQLDPEGYILDANGALLSILGLPSVQVAREINVLHFPPLVQSGFEADIHECLESGEIIISERPYTSEAGKGAYLRLHVAPVADERGKITSVQVTVQDITGQILTEEVLREYQVRFSVGRCLLELLVA